MERSVCRRKLIKITHSFRILSILKINLNLSGRTKGSRNGEDSREDELTFLIQILLASLKPGVGVIITSYYTTDSSRCWLVLLKLTFTLFVLKNILMLLVDNDAPLTIFPVTTQRNFKSSAKINFCRQDFHLTTSSLYCWSFSCWEESDGLVELWDDGNLLSSPPYISRQRRRRHNPTFPCWYKESKYMSTRDRYVFSFNIYEISFSISFFFLAKERKKQHRCDE